jgi:hypothetical protein
MNGAMVGINTSLPNALAETHRRHPRFGLSDSESGANSCDRCWNRLDTSALGSPWGRRPSGRSAGRPRPRTTSWIGRGDLRRPGPMEWSSPEAIAHIVQAEIVYWRATAGSSRTTSRR